MSVVVLGAEGLRESRSVAILDVSGGSDRVTRPTPPSIDPRQSQWPVLTGHEAR